MSRNTTPDKPRIKMVGQDYLALLERSYEMIQGTAYYQNTPKSRLEYLGDNIFNFTTYDGDMTRLFAAKAVEVVEAITSGEPHAYQRSSEGNYAWYLLMCNFDFFKKLEWGSSIRGAWWDNEDHKFHSCGLYREDGSQLREDLLFTRDEWENFMRAIVAFAAPEMTS